MTTTHAEILNAELIGLSAYQRAADQTDQMPLDDLATPIMGLFGEIGSLLAALKKKRREGTAFATYDEVISEEFGDVLWYLNAIARRATLDLSILAQRVSRSLSDWDEVAHDELGTFADLQSPHKGADANEVANTMMALASRAGDLVEALRTGKLNNNRDAISAELVGLLRILISTADVADVDLDNAARENIKKIYSRWPTGRVYPALVDDDMPRNERLPRKFEIFIEEHTVGGKTYVLQKCNGIIIGDRLTDNKEKKDDYRFHDVFHIAYAVHLGWSPVLRSLFRVKRKSRPNLDENEDGARAVLIEEGIATYIFGRGLERNLFEGLERLDYDLLKFIQHFVAGFEPSQCAPWQWEQAILDGFNVFRDLKKHRKGWVRANMREHTLTFEPGEDRAED